MSGSRRTFLRSVGTGLPTLTMLLRRETDGSVQSPVRSVAQDKVSKFTPIDLNPYFTASTSDFGIRQQAKAFSSDGFVHAPAGEQIFLGIPFLLGPAGLHAKRYAALSTSKRSWSIQQLEIPLVGQASFICLAHFCDWDENENPAPSPDLVEVLEKVGQRLGEATLVYKDGSTATQPIRRRFEVSSPSVSLGQGCFAAQVHKLPTPAQLSDPLDNATAWGDLQQGFLWSRILPIVWVCALANPHPTRQLKSLRLQSTAEDALVLCGLTLFRGSESPLRHLRLTHYQITLPEAVPNAKDRWKISVDLGVVARTQSLSPFEPSVWLSAGAFGHGDPVQAATVPSRHLHVEVAATADATLNLNDLKTGERFEFELRKVLPGRELKAKPRGDLFIEILEPERVRLRGQVVDSETGRTTPARIAFRSGEGRYIPPQGHRAQINTGLWADYGADLKIGSSSFAYVDGRFEVELPVGESYVEVSKGFEYAPVRRKLEIKPETGELKLEVARFKHLRSKGWVSADTHVHLLSPSTALLEAQAEGLNLVNLLALQMGDAFANIGDLAHGPLVSRDGDSMVWLGSENRQHILGHIGLLGGTHQNSPVFPMSVDGPAEASFGEPLWNSMAEWADECRRREGLVVAPHFPHPTGEIAADVVLGKIDAVELWPTNNRSTSEPNYGEFFNGLRFQDWYRYLNCGYRLPAVGGTDKMSAAMPVGANRTYAFLGDQEFSFANWAKAVRKGNTFMTTGPLLFFKADGRVPGEEILMRSGSGSVEVELEVASLVPFHRVDVVINGRVVATREEQRGTHQMTLRERLAVVGPAWLAARCASRVAPVTPWNFRTQAHTSPVYVRVPRQELFSAPVAKYLLTLIEGGQTYVETLAIQPDHDRFIRTLKVFQDARAALHHRLHQHGIPH